MIEDLWSIIDNKLLKFLMNNLDDFTKGKENVWSEISTNPLEKILLIYAKARSICG